jgi:hypothetical protein
MSRHFAGQAILDKTFGVAPSFTEAIHPTLPKKAA